MNRTLFFIGILTLFLNACSPSESTAQTAIANTQVAEQELEEKNAMLTSDGILDREATAESNAATKTSKHLLIATATQKPTHTNTPTITPTPTSTPEPTFTPSQTLAATPEPEPIILSGTHDSVVDFKNPFGAAIAHIVGNYYSSHFSVKSFNENGEIIELLVNTSDSYDGIVPIDFINSQKTSRFEVSAFGQWSIEILPLSKARRIKVPGVIKGNGDDIIILTGGNADTAHIVGNQADKLFSVRGYRENGIDSLINTTDPYEGTILIETGIFLLEIKAFGEWTIELEE